MLSVVDKSVGFSILFEGVIPCWQDRVLIKVVCLYSRIVFCFFYLCYVTRENREKGTYMKKTLHIV